LSWLRGSGCSDENGRIFHRSVSSAHVFGYNYPVLKLRDAVFKYEKENARLLNDPQSCFYEDPLTSCFWKLISVEDHVLSLEENRTPPDEFYVLCTALMLDMEVCIFSPSEDNKVLAKRYIEKAQYSRRIAVIYDVLQSPVRIYRPSIVHKDSLHSNPYYDYVDLGIVEVE